MQELKQHFRIAVWAIGLLIGSAATSGVKCEGQARAVDKELLAFYRQYGYFTDPGSYEALYAKLPESLPELCKVIKAQLIHPDADLPMYPKLIAAGRGREEESFPTVAAMLAGLMARNPAGLVGDRKPEERLIVSCRYHAILLASILKSRGVPVRIRYGYASYLIPGFHTYHVICEVWQEREGKWLLVDPDRRIVGVTPRQFEFAADIWLAYRRQTLAPDYYGMPDWRGGHPILSIFTHDLAAVLGSEFLYWEHPSVCEDPEMDMGKIPADRVKVLDKAAALLQEPDRNFQALKELYGQYGYLQFAK